MGGEGGAETIGSGVNGTTPSTKLATVASTLFVRPNDEHISNCQANDILKQTRMQYVLKSLRIVAIGTCGKTSLTCEAIACSRLLTGFGLGRCCCCSWNLRLFTNSSFIHQTQT